MIEIENGWKDGCIYSDGKDTLKSTPLLEAKPKMLSSMI